MAATLLGSLLVSLGLDSGQFKSGLDAAEKQLRTSQKRIEKVGQSMVGLGSKMSIAVSVPLIALGKTAVTAAIESQDAIAQVNASLKSMGGQAGRTSEQLQGLASGIMRKSLYDDDEILRKVTANLLTFGKVTGATFDRAQVAAVDLSAKFGTDLQSSTLMLGKALQDPIKGITALSRAGVSFSEAQKKMITDMVAAGDAAGAQNLILTELEAQIGGSAAAARGANPFAAMTQSFNEFQEKVGAQILKAMPAITGAITTLLEAFNSLSPGMQKVIVVAGVLAAVLGPILIVIGGLVTVAAPLIAAFTVIAGTVGGLSGILVATAASFAGLVTAMASILIPLAAVALAVGAVYLAWKNWDKIKAIAASIGSAISGWWNQTVKPVLAAVVYAVANVVKAWADLQANAIRYISNLVTGVRTWLVDKLGAVWKFVTDKIDMVKKAFFGLYDAVIGHSYVPDMVDGISREMARLDAVMVNPATKATKKTTEAFRKMAEDVAPILERLFPQAAANNLFNKDFAAIEAAAKAGQISRDTKNTALDALGAERAADGPDGPALSPEFDVGPMQVNLQTLNAEIGRLSESLATSIPKISSLSSVFDEIGIDGSELKTDLSRAFTDVLLGARSFGDAMRGVFNKLASKILDNLFDKLLGNLLGGIIPGFAGGTNFAPGGMAMVGERGPELVNLPRGSQVIPNHDLKGMSGGQEVHSPKFYFPGVTNAKEAREAAGQAARRYRQEINGPIRRVS